MTDAVVLDRVTKIYDAGTASPVRAVNDLSLRIRRGEIFSLVGPDGAGKTTTIRMMCGVLEPSGGAIEILGLDLRAQRSEVKKHIGYLSQQFSLYGDLTVSENLDFFAEIHRLRGFRQRKEELLEFTRLGAFRDRLAGRLSGGMKQKLALACTLIHTPDVIFLDEPTTGVDPVSRRDFWKILSSLLKSGISIIVSTPYLDEAERSARVALMNQGTLLQCDTPERIKSSFESEVLEIVCDDVRPALKQLQEMLSRDRIQLFGDRLHVLLPRGGREADTIPAALQQRGIRVDSVRRLSPSLEDVFIAHVNS